MKKLTLIMVFALMLLANINLKAQSADKDKKLTFMLYGASFAIPQNGWFEIACQDMGADAINKAVSGEAIYNDAIRMSENRNYTLDELDRTDVLVIMHVHNQNVAAETNLKENYEDYTVSASMGYAPAYDYVIKKYQADCAALEKNPDSKWYGVEGGKPARIMFCTHWHDGRAEYNPAIRKLAEKWKFPLIKFDENIGFSKEDNQQDKGQPSREWAHDTETLYNLQFGWHPKRGLNSPIQHRMAAIFTKAVEEAYGYEFPFEMSIKPVSEVVLPGEDAKIAVNFKNGKFPYSFTGSFSGSDLEGKVNIVTLEGVEKNAKISLDATHSPWEGEVAQKSSGSAKVLVSDYCATPDFDSYVTQLNGSQNNDSADEIQLKVAGNASRKAYIGFQVTEDMPRDAEKIILRLYYYQQTLGYFNEEKSRPIEGVEVIGIEGNTAKYNGININWSTSSSHSFEGIDATTEITSDMLGSWVSIDVTDWAKKTLAALESQHGDKKTGHLTFRLYVKDNSSNALMNFYSTEGAAKLPQVAATTGTQPGGPQLLFVNDASVEENATVTIGDALNDNPSFEWTADMASGDWSSENPFEELLITTGTVDASKLEVKITPKFDQTTQPSAWSEDCGMSQSIWNQMIAVENGVNGTKNNVDGYYWNPETTPSIDGTSITNVVIPCSGEYELSITSTDESIEIINSPVSFTVYPSTNLIYSYMWNDKEITEGINISGYSVDEDLMVVNEELAKDKYVLYIPGVYLSDISYTLDFTPSDNVNTNQIAKAVKRKVTQSGTIKNGAAMDLSGWDGSQATLYLTLSKNGATTPKSGNNETSTASIILKTGASNETTGIGVMEMLEGEAEYYNLQGVKIKNPEKGLFIKVEGGKASKIIL